MDHPNEKSIRDGKLREALRLLADLDGYRNLGTPMSIAVFAACTVLSGAAFFVISDISRWGDSVSEVEAGGITAIAYAMIFPLFIALFLGAMSLLRVAGVRDLRAELRADLSDLGLGRQGLRELKDRVERNGWRHRAIFSKVVSDLADGRT